MSHLHSLNARTITKFALIGLGLAGVFVSLSAPVTRSVKASERLNTVLLATIRPHRVATINAQFPGQVMGITSAPGTTVRAGDPLLVMSNPEFELEFERAQAHYNLVRGQRVMTSDDTRAPGEAKRALAAAQDRLALVPLDDTKKAYEKAEARRKEVQELANQHLVTAIELDQVTDATSVAYRNLQAEKEHLSRVKEEVARAQARLAEVTGSRPLDPEQARLRLQVEDAANQLEIARKRRQSQQILATVSGSVLRVLVNAGDEIPSGVPLAEIGQLDQLDFDVTATPELAHSVRAGDPVKLRLPTRRTVTAPVYGISQVSPTAYTVRLILPNPLPDGSLIGQTAEAEFQHQNFWRVFQF
jgi:multidrug resistance efflux pump